MLRRAAKEESRERGRETMSEGRRYWKFVSRKITEEERSKLKAEKVKEAEDSLAEAREWEPEENWCETVETTEDDPHRMNPLNEMIVNSSQRLNKKIAEELPSSAWSRFL